jgi:dienelactone hydrolase
MLPRCAAQVYGVFGSRDRQFGPETVGEFDALLSAAGVPHEIRSYEGRTHAFVKDLADIRQGGDSGDAWNGMLDFLKANLK